MSGLQPQHPYSTQLAMRAAIASAAEEGPIAFIDLGSFKVAAIIGAPVSWREGVKQFRLLGAGLTPARGISAGRVEDVAAASKSISGALRQAEAVAGRRPHFAIACLSGAQPRSLAAQAKIELPLAAVKRSDVARVIAEAAPPEQPPERMLLHGIATQWVLDGWPTKGDPTGRAGRELGVRMHGISVDKQAMTDVAVALRRAKLEMAAAAVSAYPAAVSILSEDERMSGAACIDFGAAQSSIAIFEDGRLSAVDAIPLGGEKITAQIAHSFDLSREDAERLKVLEGSASARTPMGTIQAQRSGGASPLSLDRAALAAAIRPRLREQLEMARDRLAQLGFLNTPGKPILLTGGAAELQGFISAAEEIFGPRARLAAPAAPDGLAAIASKGVWSAAVGLVRLAAGPPETPFEAARSKALSDGAGGLLGWLWRTF